MFLARWVAVTDSTDGADPAVPPGPAAHPVPAVPAAASAAAAAVRRFHGGSAEHARWAAVRVSALASGAVAAGLGLGVPAAVVLLLWIGAPFPDSGLSGALHVGAGLWLLAQGAELVRTGTLSGDPAPIAVTPLLLSALPAWLLHRSAASAVAAEETADGREAAVVAGWVLTGYLGVAAITVAYTAGGPLRVAPLTALYVPLFAAIATGCGAWAGHGRPLGRLWGHGTEIVAALRAAGIAAGLLLGGGALLGGLSLAWHAGASASTYAQLSGSFSGRAAVLLTAIALVPNLAVWGASYALGAGFCVGAGATVAPTGVTGHPVLPDFPLLAAVPGPGGGGIGWAALLIPAAAGAALAWCAGRPGWSAGRTLRIVTLAALFYGAGIAVLAAWSGGPLGTGLLTAFGPRAGLTGAAATASALALGLPAALAFRRTAPAPAPASWRTLVRTLRPAPAPDA